MAETKINANQTNITAEDIGAARAATVLPTASVSEEGKIYQFVGTTTASYTNGYFYKCVSDGQDPATYSWEEVEVQASSGGGLPDQTDQSGKFLTTDGTDASWSDKPFVNRSIDSTSIAILGSSQYEQVGRSKYRIVIGYGAVIAGASNSNDIVIGNSAHSSINTEGANIVIGTSASGGGGESIAIGGGSSVGSKHSISIGQYASASGGWRKQGNIAIGYNANVAGTNGAIQFNNGTNNESGTMCVALSTDGSTWNNHKLLDSDGTIPTDRFTTTPSADGTYVPTLTISSGVATRSWAAPGGGGATSATATLAVNDWSSNTQTVSVQGVSSSNTILVAPAPSSNADYVSAGILCTTQSTNSLTFTCQTVPSSAIIVNIVILN